MREFRVCGVKLTICEVGPRFKVDGWADDEPERALLARGSFMAEKLMEVRESPALGHAGGGLLLVREIAIATVS